MPQHSILTVPRAHGLVDPLPKLMDLLRVRMNFEWAPSARRAGYGMGHVGAVFAALVLVAVRRRLGHNCMQ